MAYFKYKHFIIQSESSAFDITFEPNDKVLISGIYRCENCGENATFVCGHKIPPQNHHQHENQQLPIIWRLVASAGLV